jgi:hypothetical protein
MGILGRRRARKTPDIDTDRMELLARQLASPDPALRLLAAEAKILAFGTARSAPGTAVPFPVRDTLKTRRNAGVSKPRHLPKITCRHCGRPPHHFGTDQICDRCERMRTQIENTQVNRASIADRRGWTGPPTIGDHELLSAIMRRLRDTEQRRLALDARDVRKAKRNGRRAKFEE